MVGFEPLTSRPGTLCSINWAIQESIIQTKNFVRFILFIFSWFFEIFFQKIIFEITNLELYFGNHQESLTNWLGLVHLMLLYRKKPNLASQIHPTANSEFFKKKFINTKMIFLAKTAKWSLLLSFQGKNVKPY